MQKVERLSYKEGDNVEAKSPYELAKRRLAASKLVASGLKDRLQKGYYGLRDQMDEGFRKSGGDIVYAPGYNLDRIKVVHRDPLSGSSEEEQVVIFHKLDEEGNMKMLTFEDGKQFFLNGDLYDSRVSTGWAGKITESRNFVPSVDHEGKIVKVIALIEENKIRR